MFPRGFGNSAARSAGPETPRRNAVGSVRLRRNAAFALRTAPHARITPRRRSARPATTPVGYAKVAFRRARGFPPARDRHARGHVRAHAGCLREMPPPASACRATARKGIRGVREPRDISVTPRAATWCREAPAHTPRPPGLAPAGPRLPDPRRSVFEGYQYVYGKENKKKT